MENKRTKSQNTKKKSIKNLKFSRKHLAMLLSGTILIGAASGIYKLGEKHGIKETQNTFYDENELGYDNINVIYNSNVDEKNFVILDIGDHDTVKTSFQNKKMTMCNNENISLGVIISSDAKDECDIYNDVEYIKGIVRDYKIDFPVYLNIDKIINNKKLNNEMKTKIIRAFLDKCSANGIYVGMTGTDTNLCRVREYCNITNYDAYVIMDEPEIKYDGPYTVYKDLKGNIRSKQDISEIIANKNLNNPESFQNDSKYFVNGEEDVVDIALQYGMSSDDLLDFNEIKSSKIKDGTIIRIPCKIEKNTTETENDEYTTEIVEQDEFLVGCDISYCQENNNDWDQLKDNFDFIILKCNQGTVVDPYFETNAKNCTFSDIPMGVYCYNDYWRDDCGDDLELFRKQQVAQADQTIALLNNKKIDYPVYLDIEHSAMGSDHLSKAQANIMLDVWYEKMSAAGYIPGVYYNRSTAEFLQSYVDEYQISDKFEVWIAGGSQYNVNNEDGEIITYSLDEVKPTAALLNGDYGMHMCQSTATCVGAGSATASGYLDIDFSNVDYTKVSLINNEEAEASDDNNTDFTIKKFKRINKALPISLISVGVLGGTAIGVHLYTTGKLKRKKKGNQKIKSK